jgi:hypothetical protein
VSVRDIPISAGSEWRYLDTGIDPGGAWRTLNFNDAAWRSGHAQLGYGEDDESTVVRYGADPNNKYVTTWFRRTFRVSDASATTNLLLRLLRDDGAIVYINGVEVFRSNMTNGVVTATTFAATVVGDTNETTFFERNISPNVLVAGTNIIAVELHQANATSSDLGFDLELIADAAIGPQLAVVSIEATTPDTSESAPNIRVRPGVFTLKRTGNAINSLTVFLTYEGTAIPGKDYEQLGQFVSFPAGASEVELLVKSFDDELVEADESVVSTLTGSPFDRLPDYTIDPQNYSARIVIHDTDMSSIATSAASPRPRKISSRLA